MFPTSDPELNAVLDEFTRGACSVLGENLLALYLQGSFGVGDWDIYSDVDFLAVVERDLTSAEVAGLNDLHTRIYHLPPEWAKHLEGSYFPKDVLRRMPAVVTALYYLDNTAQTLIRSTHDNTRVVRWVVREHGIPLLGGDARQWIDPVDADELRQEVRDTMREWGDEIFGGEYNIHNCWAQPFVVISYCRMLQTLQTGTIESKLAGVRWGLRELDARWADLIQRAWEERPDPTSKFRTPANPRDVENTLEFIRYALESIGLSGTQQK